MATRMLQRRGTSSQWTSANPVLGEGEIGWESDTNKFKIGDGVNEWADLSYFLDEDALGGSIDDYVPLTAVGVTVAPIAGPTFTGTVTLPGTTSIGDISATELGYLDGVTSNIQTQINNISPDPMPQIFMMMGA